MVGETVRKVAAGGERIEEGLAVSGVDAKTSELGRSLHERADEVVGHETDSGDGHGRSEAEIGRVSIKSCKVI